MSGLSKERLFAMMLPALAVAAALAAIAAGHASVDGPTEQAVLVARYSARVSLALFVVAYVLGPARRTWLLSFVLAHLIHFATMVHLFATVGPVPRTHELMLGGLAYAVPLAAWLVPGDAHARWRQYALDYVWLSFAITYYHRLFEFPDRRAAGAFAFVFLLAALAARLVVARRQA